MSVHEVVAFANRIPANPRTGEWCAHVYPDGTYCPLASENHIKGRTTHDFASLTLLSPNAYRHRLVVVGRAIP